MSLTNSKEIKQYEQKQNSTHSQYDKFKEIISAIGDGVNIINEDYILEFQNEFIQKRFGNWLGEKCYFALNLNHPCPSCKIQEVIKTGTPEIIQLLTPDERIYEIRFSRFIDLDEKTKVIEIIRDITKNKRMEEVLRQSEERYRTLVEESFDGMWIQKGFKIVFANRRLHEMLGYEIGELEGLDHWLVYHPDYQNLTRERARARMRGESVPTTYEVQFLRKDGSSFWGEINAKVINFLGEPGVQVWARDITGRKAIEEALRDAEEQLRQSQKMEAIGRLAGGIAHDFNNLLTVIKGYCQLSLLELKEGDPLRENLVEIQKASQRASDLTRQLLAFSRRQVMEMKVIDLNSLLRDLDKMLRRMIGEDIELTILLSEDLGRVKADPAQIEQVILNLAVNARDAMPSGGKLIIETANVELDENYALRHGSLTPGQYAMIAVSDTGCGMTPEVKERIFEPFFTTKEKGKGTGMGLPMVYGVVKQSGGHIWVDSEPGKGTTFKIYLPRIEVPFQETEKKVTENQPFTGNETILVVEDEEEVRKLVIQILRRQGYKLLEASNWKEALIISKQSNDLIHLMLTDVVMPEMSGRELAEHLKLSYPEMKVLYMSGYTDNAIVHHGVLDEGVHFIQKPFTPDALSRKVREVLNLT